MGKWRIAGIGIKEKERNITRSKLHILKTVVNSCVQRERLNSGCDDNKVLST